MMRRLCCAVLTVAMTGLVPVCLTGCSDDNDVRTVETYEQTYEGDRRPQRRPRRRPTRTVEKRETQQEGEVRMVSPGEMIVE